jgi:glutamate carboxypeptidase
MDPALTELAQSLAPRVLDETRELVALSTPSGEIPNTERAIELCSSFLGGWSIERLPCSTEGCAPDLLASVRGDGARRLLFLGHLDTVVAHGEHQPAREQGERLYGSGTADMKGGVALSMAVARACAEQRELYAELAVLLVCDEEWRIAEFAHTERFAGYDACLCFEAGEVSEAGEDGVIVRRKGAGTLRVRATGRASHSGSAPHQGRNALLALARTADAVAALHDPAGPEQLSAVPTVMRSGDAFNIVPAEGELIFDLRARRLDAFDAVLAAVAPELDEVALTARMERRWPGMDSTAATGELLAGATHRLGRRVAGVPRGGASDASHFADTIPLTVDGLGPRGGGAHTPEEFVLTATLRERAEVALALALEALALAKS